MLDEAREPSPPKTRLRSGGEGRAGEAGPPVWYWSCWRGSEEYVESVGDVGEAWLPPAALDDVWDARAELASVEGPCCWPRLFLREKSPIPSPSVRVRACQPAWSCHGTRRGQAQPSTVRWTLKGSRTGNAPRSRTAAPGRVWRTCKSAGRAAAAAAARQASAC